MGQPIQFTKALIAANATSVAAVQARGSSGNLTLGTTSLDSQRRLAITLTASNSGAVIIIAGTNDGGNAIGETITVGATATAVASAMDYKSVTSISSTTLTGNISVGTNGTGSSPWILANYWSTPGIHVAVTAPNATSATYTTEYTLDPDPCGIRSSAVTAVAAFSAALQTAITTSSTALITAGTSGIPVPVSAWRVTTTTGTGSLIVQALDSGDGAG